MPLLSQPMSTTPPKNEPASLRTKGWLLIPALLLGIAVYVSPAMVIGTVLLAVVIVGGFVFHAKRENRRIAKLKEEADARAAEWRR